MGLISWFRRYVGRRSHRELKKNLVSGIFPGKIDSAMLGFECTINRKHFIKIVLPIFEKIEMFNFLLCELPLISEVNLRWKQTEWRYLQGDLDMEFERDWSDGLGAPLDNGHTEELKYIFFSVSGIFPGKADSITLLGFECTINLQNLIKFVEAIFEKIEILKCFLT